MRMTKIVCLVLIFCIWITTTHLYSDGPFTKPTDGYVPNEKTAILIAEAVLYPIYGEKKIKSERPFKASLKNGVWIVEGTFNKPKGWLGGVALVEISKESGCILRVIHEK